MRSIFGMSSKSGTLHSSHPSFHCHVWILVVLVVVNNGVHLEFDGDMISYGGSSRC